MCKLVSKDSPVSPAFPLCSLRGGEPISSPLELLSLDPKSNAFLGLLPSATQLLCCEKSKPDGDATRRGAKELWSTAHWSFLSKPTSTASHVSKPYWLF